MTAFDWNSFWAQPVPVAPWLTDGAREQVRAAVDDGWLTPGMTVLDLGCGLGNGAAWLAEHGFEVVAIDASSTAISRARDRHASTPRVRFETADVAGPDRLGMRFDAILDCGCLHALPEAARDGYRRNLSSWSIPGTRLLLMARYGVPLFAKETPETREALIRELLVPPFDLVRMSRTNMASAESGAERPGLLCRLRRPDSEGVS